ncbi:hypothetical protein MSAN_01594200 [Mycena sanguinolenta]|uniref:Uncharacterized protein n=1 Tax=Mycena sanguinolenta TaxID=230812 RepID=A0A8H6Y2T2_9AGAR|nr:hypothetical protein MSAN_01594200 [Mycena sanguinolenta]
MSHAVTAHSGDKAIIGSWVFGLDSKGATIIGRVAELLIGEKSLVTLEQFICTDVLHPDFGWPVIRRPNGTEITAGKGESHVVLEAKSIQFICSVQHDCRMGNCKPGISRAERQEREETNRQTMLIKHADDDQFVLNMSALHNFAKLRRVLPQSVTKLKVLHEDRLKFHKEMATQARSIRIKKRKKTADKRRQTAEAKRKDAELAAAAAAEAEEALRRAEEGEDDSDEDEREPEECQDEPQDAPEFDNNVSKEDEDDLEESNAGRSVTRQGKRRRC